jgi:predicted aspartyl protease
MGRTLATATINGPLASKEYSFLVDTGASFVGLPITEIQELGLSPVPNGKRRFMTATGVVELDTYTAIGMVENEGFTAWVMPAPIPIIGYELLENLRFRVNPVSQRLEKVPDEVEDHPPYLLSVLEIYQQPRSGIS